MFIRKILPHIVLAAILGTIPLIICAGSVGRISGIVTDAATGDPLIGVSIQIENTKMATKSGVDGNFAVPSLPAGNYTVRVSMLGYETVIIEDLDVKSDQTIDLKIQLRQQTIETGKITVVKGSKKGVEVNQNGVVSIKTRKDKPAAPKVASGELMSREGETTRSNDADLYSGSARLQSIDNYQPHGQPFDKKRCRPVPDYIPQPPYYPHGGSANVNGEPFDAMFFKNYGVNPFVDTEDDHLSTFAVDVDDASYILARSYLDRGYLPPADAIRVEEFINHFDFEYEIPRHRPFEVFLEGAPSRFGQNCQLLRIGVQGKNIDRCERKPANLVFLVDVSGSMNRENRLELVKSSLMYLVDQLDPGDRIGLVIYDTQAREVFQPMSVRNRYEIERAIRSLHPGGSTNLDHGLKLAYHMAERNFRGDRINRIVLCSDGVANVGTTSAEELLKKIKYFADRGITLTAIGVGMGNHNDALLEQLGDKGNGHYAYVDDLDEARRIFVEKLTGTLQVIARDVKIQVDFDPRVVRSYRLLGYENRDVADNKFRDDREDGGEIGAGHQVTALYEIKLHHTKPGYDLGRVFIRFKDADGYEVSEFMVPVARNVLQRNFNHSSPQFRLATCAAEFAEIMKKSYWARGSSIRELYAVARRVADELNSPDVDEFIRLIQQVEAFEDALAEREW